MHVARDDGVDYTLHLEDDGCLLLVTALDGALHAPDRVLCLPDR